MEPQELLSKHADLFSGTINGTERQWADPLAQVSQDGGQMLFFLQPSFSPCKLEVVCNIFNADRQELHFPALVYRRAVWSGYAGVYGA